MALNPAFLSGLGVGAGLMFLLDPGRGARRRALVRDKVVRGAHVTSDAVGTAARDLRHRAEGLSARLQRSRHDGRVDDDVLVEQVRSAIGRYVSHPRALDVFVRDGVVTLSGHILTAEVRGLQSAARGVRGVRDVISLLSEHDEPGSEPSLQGEGARRRRRLFRWPPATRLLAGASGAAFAVYGARRFSNARSMRRPYESHW